jgi:predicted MFS family arabinose efflux permease
MLAASVVLLTSFVLWQRRSKNPLLPLSVVTDRRRGGSYAAIGIAGAGMFGVFLFLTYFLQRNLGLSPIETGLAFLPMSATIIVTATLGQTKLVPRFGARKLMTLGMLFSATGMVILAQLDASSVYASGVLPALLVQGIGMGLVFAPAFAGATFGVKPSDAGVASAMVNTSQQVGGSIGTALLSTIASSATSSYFAGKAASPAVANAAAIHGFTTAFWWAAGIFAVGSMVTWLLVPEGATSHEHAPDAAPVMAH